MTKHSVVSKTQWLDERKALLAKEKELTRLRDELSEQRRQLPWVVVDKDYHFNGTSGPCTLSGLFGPHSQLIVQHFMFGIDW